MLKRKLKEWGSEHRNNWKQKKEKILDQLTGLEKIQELRVLLEDEIIQKMHLSMLFEEVSKNEEIAWRQRFGVQWLKRGDKHKYFHKIATTPKRFNSIDTLTVDGDSVTNPEDIKTVIVNFYQNLYNNGDQTLVFRGLMA